MMTQKDYQALCWGWGVSVIARSVNLRQTHCSRIVSGPTFILKVHPSTHPPTHPPTIHPPLSGWHKSEYRSFTVHTLRNGISLWQWIASSSTGKMSRCSFDWGYPLAWWQLIRWTPPLLVPGAQYARMLARPRPRGHQDSKASSIFYTRKRYIIVILWTCTAILSFYLQTMQSAMADEECNTFQVAKVVDCFIFPHIFLAQHSKARVSKLGH